MASTRKTFTTGATLPASDLNTYLMEQSVVKVDTTTDLNATLASQGVRVAYCIANNRVYYYNGTTWVNDQAVNSGFGAGSSVYRWTEHYGSTNAALTVGNYYIPFQLEASTQLAYVGLKAATFVTTTAFSATLYSSLNGLPYRKLGANATGSIASTTAVDILAGGSVGIVRPGLYYWAIGIAATTTNTYACVVQSATQGGPVYMSQGSGLSDWGLMPPGGFRGTAGTYTSSWPTTCEAVTPAATVPILRYQMNYTLSPSTPESGA